MQALQALARVWVYSACRAKVVGISPERLACPREKAKVMVVTSASPVFRTQEIGRGLDALIGRALKDLH